MILLDTSILVPYLAGTAYGRYLWGRLAREQVYVSSVSVMELLAGCTSQSQRRKVEDFASRLRLRERSITPNHEEWLRAGRIIARYQVRYGYIRPGAHIADLLILLVSERLGAELATENGEHFRLWSRFLVSKKRPSLTILDRQEHLN